MTTKSMWKGLPNLLSFPEGAPIKTNLFIRSLFVALVLGFSYAECLSQTSRSSAEIKFVEMRFRKPPLVELVFDVVLRNDRAQPRWFLLPSHMYPDKPGIPENGGVNTLEVFAPRGKGRVVIGRFLGTGGFQALLLPAHAEIHLRGLPVEYWGDPPESLQLEVIEARRLTIGSEPATSWFQTNPICGRKADITEIVSGRTRMLSSHHTRDNIEVSARIDEDLRFKIQVSLKDNGP